VNKGLQPFVEPMIVVIQSVLVSFQSTGCMKNSLLSIAVLCAMALAFASCDSNTGPAVTIPAAPREIAALSADETVVRLRWKASTSEATLAGYRITVTPMGGTAQVLPVNRAASADTSTVYTVNVTGLRAGVIYTFSVQARTNDTVSAGANIMWSPALRLRGRVYESESSFASAVSFQGGTLSARPIANATEAARADFAIATPNDSLYFGTPNRLYRITGGRETQYDRTGFYPRVDSLNAIYEPELSAMNFQVGVYGIRPTTTPGLLVYARTPEGNFAKIFMRSGANGVLLQGTRPNRFIDLEISYQPTAAQGFTLLAAKNTIAVQSVEVHDGRVAGAFFTEARNFTVSPSQR